MDNGILKIVAIQTLTAMTIILLAGPTLQATPTTDYEIVKLQEKQDKLCQEIKGCEKGYKAWKKRYYQLRSIQKSKKGREKYLVLTDNNGQRYTISKNELGLRLSGYAKSKTIQKQLSKEMKKDPQWGPYMAESKSNRRKAMATATNHYITIAAEYLAGDHRKNIQKHLDSDIREAKEMGTLFRDEGRKKQAELAQVKNELNGLYDGHYSDQPDNGSANSTSSTTSTTSSAGSGSGGRSQSATSTTSSGLLDVSGLGETIGN